jgi:hypothetical protein
MTDQTTMTIDDVIEAFGTANTVLPREAMQWALDNWTRAAPRFLELLARCADGTDRSQKTADTLFFIVHLLGEKSETAAFGELCRLLQAKDAARLVLGDAITTTLRRILISTYDGDVAALHAVIEAAEADEFVRDAAILTLAYLTRIGRIPEADTHAYLRHLLTAMQPQGPCYVWVGWTECAAALGFADFAPDVQQLFEHEFIEDFTMKYSDFEADLKLTLDDPERMAGLADKRLTPFTGAIEELSRWASFSEDRTRNESWRDEPRPAEPQLEWPLPGSARNPLRSVGRNDPCPCGSGKKFKKCCLGKPEAERLIASAVRGV